MGGETIACWWCGYDMRGSPSTRCPECGALAEDHPVPWRPGKRLLGWSAAAVSLSASAFALTYTFLSADLYVREMHSWCGTPRLAAMTTLSLSVPMFECVALLGWGIARKVHVAIAPARCAALASAAAWLAAIAFITWAR